MEGVDTIPETPPYPTSPASEDHLILIIILPSFS